MSALDWPKVADAIDATLSLHRLNNLTQHVSQDGDIAEHCAEDDGLVEPVPSLDLQGQRLGVVPDGLEFGGGGGSIHPPHASRPDTSAGPK